MAQVEKIAEAKSRLFRIRFIHAIQRGLFADQIAKRLGISKYSVRDRAKRYGLTICKPKRVRKFNPTDDDFAALRDEE